MRALICLAVKTLFPSTVIPATVTRRPSSMEKARSSLPGDSFFFTATFTSG